MATPSLLIVCNDLDYFLLHRAHIARHLVNQGWTVCLASGGRRDRHGLDPAIEFVPVRVKRYGFSIVADLGLAWVIGRAMVRRRFSAIHTITVKPNVVGAVVVRVMNAFRSKPVPLVMMVPGLGRLFERETWRARLRFILFRGVMRRAASGPHVSAVFENDGDRVEWVSMGLVNEQRARVVPGTGVDPDRFVPAPRQNPVPIILLASRLLRAKGVAVYLAAAQRLSDAGHAVEFRLAGRLEPDDPDAITASEIAASPAVRFLGFREAIEKDLAEADIVCLPTRYPEGIPRILIEAAASGCALIASDQPGCRLVVENGRNGVLLGRYLESQDALSDELVAAIIDMVGDRDRLAAMGRHSRQIFLNGAFAEADVAAVFSAILEKVTTKAG